MLKPRRRIWLQALADNRAIADQLRRGGCSVAYAAVVQLVTCRPDEFSAQELSICLKSTADFEPALPAADLLAFLRAVEPAMLRRMRECTPMGLGKLINGYVSTRSRRIPSHWIHPTEPPWIS